MVGGSQAIVEQGREIWYRWSQQQWKAVRLLGRVVAGREPGRSDDKQIIAFMNQGEGMQFAAVGRKLYDLAREVGAPASLCDIGFAHGQLGEAAALILEHLPPDTPRPVDGAAVDGILDAAYAGRRPRVRGR